MRVMGSEAHLEVQPHHLVTRNEAARRLAKAKRVTFFHDKVLVLAAFPGNDRLKRLGYIIHPPSKTIGNHQGRFTQPHVANSAGACSLLEPRDAESDARLALELYAAGAHVPNAANADPFHLVGGGGQHLCGAIHDEARGADLVPKKHTHLSC